MIDVQLFKTVWYPKTIYRVIPRHTDIENKIKTPVRPYDPNVADAHSFLFVSDGEVVWRLRSP